jgi:nitrogen regulatory protein PII-like uncharacterized protein
MKKREYLFIDDQTVQDHINAEAHWFIADQLEHFFITQQMGINPGAYRDIQFDLKEILNED